MIGCLALLMFGMKTMSEGLQKLTGGHLRAVLGTMTKHRLGGLLTGTFVTAAVQSSTATTVMTVSFVNAGLLTLKQAIPVIMGANIGTTATAWIMSIFGFQFNMSSFVWPFFGLGIALSYVRKNSVKSFGEFVFGFAFMFLGLTTLRENAVAMDLAHNEAIINFFATTGGWGMLSTLLFLLLGGILTMCVQSSAAIMAITLILCSSGVLPIYQGIALVMGENGAPYAHAGHLDYPRCPYRHDGDRVDHEPRVLLQYCELRLPGVFRGHHSRVPQQEARAGRVPVRCGIPLPRSYDPQGNRIRCLECGRCSWLC